jgi:hypothetical protein
MRLAIAFFGARGSERHLPGKVDGQAHISQSRYSTGHREALAVFAVRKRHPAHTETENMNMGSKRREVAALERAQSAAIARLRIREARLFLFKWFDITEPNARATIQELIVRAHRTCELRLGTS